MPEPLQVGLIFGGRSVEHAISVRSARSVLQTLRQSGHQVQPIAIGPDGAWFMADNALGVEDPSRPQGKWRPVALAPEPGAGLRLRAPDGEVLHPDVYFPLVHGVGGEDGTLQGLLEAANVPFVGSGVAASALGMDKGLCKAVWRQAGLPVLDWREVTAMDWRKDADGVLAGLRTWKSGKLFAKPANGGSSLGVGCGASDAERRQIVGQALEYDICALLEPALDAREIEVAVMGNHRPAATLPGEIIPAAEFYDYAAKYEDSRTRLLVPAPLEADLCGTLQDLARRAFSAVRCQGLARVDFLLDRQSLRPYLSEINTMPGFTDVSMFPRLWEAAGVSYPDLLNQLLDLALDNAAARRQLRRRMD